MRRGSRGGFSPGAHALFAVAPRWFGDGVRLEQHEGPQPPPARLNQGGDDSLFPKATLRAPAPTKAKVAAVPRSSLPFVAARMSSSRSLKTRVT